MLAWQKLPPLPLSRFAWICSTSFSASVVDVCLFILTLQEKHSAKFKALAGRIVAFVGRDIDVEISIGKKK